MAPKLRERHDELELAIARLRDTKDALPRDDYYRRLEQLMLELAELYSQPSIAP
jgi:hypothetical protein